MGRGDLGDRSGNINPKCWEGRGGADHGGGEEQDGCVRFKCLHPCVLAVWHDFMSVCVRIGGSPCYLRVSSVNR